MKTIGISGFAQSGKTTAANYIEKVYGYERVHIATTLRSMLAVLLQTLGYSQADVTDILEGSRKDGWIIPELGCTSRHLQITIGTEWGRQLVCDDIWVKTWMASLEPASLSMNDSVRFPNEEKGIQSTNGFTILIEREGTGPAAFKWGFLGKLLYRKWGIMWGVHPSERTDLLKPTYRLYNNSTVEGLYRDIDAIMAKEGIQPERSAA